MRNLERALFEYLTGDAGVSSLVESRVYPVKLPEGSNIPAISWRKVDAGRIYTYDRFEDTDAWVTARVQMDCWGYTADEATNVGEAVLMALSGYEGDMAGQLIGSSFAVNELDIYEVPTKLHRRILDFQISYEDDLAGAS